MNRTQRATLLNLSGFSVNLVFLGYLLLTIFAFQRLPNRPAAVIWLLVFAAQFGWMIFLLRKKQSPAEPETDERDKTIMKNAVLVSFVSTWLLLAAATLIPALLLGEGGSVPVYILTFINFGVFLLAGLVYFAATLVQYGWGGKHE